MNEWQIMELKRKGNLCNVCKKKEAKWVMGKNSPVLKMNFCSKTCIANHTIKHYKMEKTNTEGENR